SRAFCPWASIATAVTPSAGCDNYPGTGGDRRSLRGAARGPRRDGGLLGGGQRALILERAAAAVVDHEVRRHGAGRGQSRLAGGFRLGVGVVVERERGDAAVLVAGNALRIVDG